VVSGGSIGGDRRGVGESGSRSPLADRVGREGSPHLKGKKKDLSKGKRRDRREGDFPKGVARLRLVTKESLLENSGEKLCKLWLK